MSEKLGFTFYPQDWWTSDTFLDLDLIERYIFLECMFMMYQNNGVMKTQKTQIQKRHGIIITDEQWKNVTNKFIEVEDGYTMVSVNKRLKKAITNRENGAKGGRPKKPKKPSLETQNNPPLERESEIENKVDDYTPPSHNFFTIHELSKLEIGQNEFTLLAVRQSRKTIDQVKSYFNIFIKDQKALNKITWKDEADAKQHFINWLKKQQTVSSNRNPSN